MSVRSDTSTDRLSGAGPAIGTGNFSWGFWWRSASTSPGNVCTIAADLDTSTGNFYSLEIDSATLKLYSHDGNSGTGFSFSVDTWYYIVITRGPGTSNNAIFRVFTDSATPVFTSGTSAVTSGDDMTVAERGYGDSFNPAQDMQFEAEKWELAAEWSDAEAWAEAQFYALQRAGGTAEILCYLTNTDADSEGLNDVAGTAQNLTNSGFVNGADHPPELETLGGAAGPIFLPRSQQPDHQNLIASLSL